MRQIRSSNRFTAEELDDNNEELTEGIEEIPDEFLETEYFAATKA